MVVDCGLAGILDYIVRGGSPVRSLAGRRVDEGRQADTLDCFCDLASGFAWDIGVSFVPLVF